MYLSSVNSLDPDLDLRQYEFGDVQLVFVVNSRPTKIANFTLYLPLYFVRCECAQVWSTAAHETGLLHYGDAGRRYWFGSSCEI